MSGQEPLQVQSRYDKDAKESETSSASKYCFSLKKKNCLSERTSTYSKINGQKFSLET